MMTLSVAQPWAWALVSGPKRLENRTWRTDHRGDLAIHAGRRRDYLREFTAAFPAPEPDCPQSLPGLPAEKDHVFGALIGIVNLDDCNCVEVCEGMPFAEGPFCWRISNPRPLAEPVPVRGYPGLWDCPEVDAVAIAMDEDDAGRSGPEPPKQNQPAAELLALSGVTLGPPFLG